MDILISPVSDLTSYPIIFIALILYLVVVYLMFWYASKNTDKKWARGLVGYKNEDVELTKKEIETNLGNKFLSVLMICIICFFLGIGIGSGKRVSERIAENKLDYKHLITFNTNNETKQVYLIGSNSANFFYIEKENNHITISPVAAIKSIEILKK